MFASVYLVFLFYLFSVSVSMDILILISEHGEWGN